TVRHLLLQRSLERVVVRVHYVLPRAEVAIVVVGEATIAIPGAAELIGNRGSNRKHRSRIPVDVLSAEDLMASGADIIEFSHPLAGDFALDAQEVVVDVWVANTLREDDARQDGDVRVKRSPAGKVAGGLRAEALSRIGCRPAKCGFGVRIGRASRRGTSGG